MKIKASSKHKFNTEQFLPAQVLRGTVKTSKLLKMAQIGDLNTATQQLNITTKKK